MINIQSDSRKIKKGDIFIALRGISSDGHSYINKAIENGASKIVAEEGNYSVLTEIVPDTRKYLNNYLKDNYNYLLKKMKIVGITGTNGKTTTAYLVYDALNKIGHKAAYIGTIGFYIDKKITDLPNTTVDICDMYDLLIQCYEAGCETVILEVSSHSLAMGRIETLSFDIAVFTNLTQDHLDYHKNMENYALAKQILFNKLNEFGVAIINIDDSYKDYFLLDKNKNITYGFNNSDFQLKEFSMNNVSSEFSYQYMGKKYFLKSNLIGKYNLYNLIAAIAILHSLKISLDDINSVIPKLMAPVGRMEKILYKSNSIIIDYAHTPDAIEKIIMTMKEIVEGNIYVVFGCTGGRDRTKRSIMTNIVSKNSKYFIITNDDPHFEDTSQIVNDMIDHIDAKNYEICLDRQKAIEKGIKLLNDKDVLLILGKGHEEFMIIGNEKIPFNDKKTVLKILENI